MEVFGFNESSSEKNFSFYVKDTNEANSFYRIAITEIRELLMIEEMPANEIESTAKFKELDKELLIRKSTLYARRMDGCNWEYYLDQFVVPCINFNGFSDFPPHVYKSGLGFTGGFGNAFDKGIRAFLGNGDDKLELKELSVSKGVKTSLRKIHKKGYKLNISIDDYEKLYKSVGDGKKTGAWMSLDSVSSFLHNKFPEISKYKSNGKSNDLKKIFLASMDISIIDKLSKEEYVKVEDFYSAFINKKGKKDDFLQRNFLKISESNLESILDEFKENLDKNPKEQKWQSFFEKNIFIFDSRYINFISKHCIKSGRSSEPDFLVYDIYGYIDIYEIKKSDVALLQYDNSHDNYYWTSEVSKAIAQLEKYIFTCTQERLTIESTLKVEKNLELKIIRPKGVLVIGSRKNISDNSKIERDFEILRSSLKNIEIILYDEIYERLKNLKIGSLRVSEKKNE